MLKSFFERLQKRPSKLSVTPAIQERAVPDRGTPDPLASPTVVDPSKTATGPAAFTIATTAEDIFRVEEVTEAEFYIGDLFRRRFGADPPNYPRHFVAFYRSSLNNYQA